MFIVDKLLGNDKISVKTYVTRNGTVVTVPGKKRVRNETRQKRCFLWSF